MVPATWMVGRHTVPLVKAHFPTTVYFRSGEHGRGERGAYHFWTAVLSEPRRYGGRVRRVVIARALAVLPPVERLERMREESRTAKLATDRAAYRAYWRGVLECGRNVARIRPSTCAEVLRWMRTHPKDARHVFAANVGGRSAARPA